MARVKVSVRTSKAERKLRRAEKLILKTGNATVLELAQLGKQKARSVVPVFSGRTHDFIRVLKTRGKDGIKARIMAFNPTKSDGHLRRIANFNLVRWMHTSARAARHIKSGDERFMFTTRNYLNRIKKGVATGRYKSINFR